MAMMATLRNSVAARRLRRAFQRARVLPEIRPTGTETKPLSEVDQSLDIMFFVNKYNGLSQRMAQELTEIDHRVDVREVTGPEQMISIAKHRNPDLIICPFLTRRVPKEVWSNAKVPCLIVHPGIEGDRGISSIDWALKEQASSWGVTIMQAEEEMDTGDIWSTTNFDIDRPNINTLTKSSLYSNEISRAAVRGGLEAIQNYINGMEPRPLDYTRPNVMGTLKRNMKKPDRVIDWEQSSEEVSSLVRMSDSSPGAVARIRSGEKWSEEMRVFGAYIERSGLQDMKGVPGEVLGQRDGAILVKCGTGAMWLSHIKKSKLKLPSMLWLGREPFQPLPTPPLELPDGAFPETFQEIWTSVTADGVCYVNFEFYNGAMSTGQCKRLEAVLAQIERDDRVTVVVLKGGLNFFSNGIHLNVIENADDPAHESWRNINAINDVVQRIFMSGKVVISAIQGNAGAGGAMMALASDFIFSREGVVFNPHYRTMQLHGSEYHTHFLPQRVGDTKAQQLLEAAAPMIAAEAVRIGFLDGAHGDSHREFDEFVQDAAEHIASRAMIKLVMSNKLKNRNEEWVRKLQRIRHEELAVMAQNFESEEYRSARKLFVYH